LPIRRDSSSNQPDSRPLTSFVPHVYQQETIITHKQEQEETLSPNTKRILIVDNESDITLTFKKGLETENNENNLFKVYTYNDPLEGLSQFKPNFYDLLLVDINMPKMDGFEFSAKILELDVNIKICFMSSGLINQEALREQYPSLSIGCFIRKPLKIKDLVRRLKAELE
jgi:CheY-like chemotaxis protein